MEADPDELAGVVDLFGGLTREELRDALADLAARSGEPFDADAIDAAVDRSVEEYYLVGIEFGPDGADGQRTVNTGDGADGQEGGDEDGGADGQEGGDEEGGAGQGQAEEASGKADEEELLVAGPTSLPRLPEGGEDLPHLVDVGPREVDREAVGGAALSRLHGDAARAVNEEDDERIETLLDVCYDLEAWAPVETDALRGRLDDARRGRSN